jgi:hypothetical protein
MALPVIRYPGQEALGSMRGSRIQPDRVAYCGEHPGDNCRDCFTASPVYSIKRTGCGCHVPSNVNDDFSADGRLKDSGEAGPSPDGRTDIGTLGLSVTLGPEEEAALPFVLSWNFPNVLNYFDVVPKQRGGLLRNHYAERFPDAWAAAEYLVQNLERLEKELIEGYVAMAEEDLETAEANLEAGVEALK